MRTGKGQQFSEGFGLPRYVEQNGSREPKEAHGPGMISLLRRTSKAFLVNNRNTRTNEKSYMKTC